MHGVPGRKVNRGIIYINLHVRPVFGGEEISTGKTVNRGTTIFVLVLRLQVGLVEVLSPATHMTRELPIL